MGNTNGSLLSDEPYKQREISFMVTVDGKYDKAATVPSNNMKMKHSGPENLNSMGDMDGIWYRDITAIKEGPYVHAICGKGFPTKSAVKKHHWGPKPGDLETTRGCWAKNNKPDVAW